LGSITTNPDAWPLSPFFDDLHLNSNIGKVDRISDGLEIKGKDTFKFNIADNKGKAIQSKYPIVFTYLKLKMCLLLPQHRVQEVGNWQTLMGNCAHDCVLNWNGGRRQFPST
jgi:hypothetical protein